MNCAECKQGIISNKDVVKQPKYLLNHYMVVSDTPSPESVSYQVEFFHKDCAPTKEIKQIAEIGLHNPVVNHFLDMKIVYDWTWRKTLTELTLFLIDENQKYKDHALQSLLNK